MSEIQVYKRTSSDISYGVSFNEAVSVLQKLKQEAEEKGATKISFSINTDEWGDYPVLWVHGYRDRTEEEEKEEEKRIREYNQHRIENLNKELERLKNVS